MTHTTPMEAWKKAKSRYWTTDLGLTPAADQAAASVLEAWREEQVRELRDQSHRLVELIKAHDHMFGRAVGVHGTFSGWRADSNAGYGVSVPSTPIIGEWVEDESTEITPQALAWIKLRTRAEQAAADSATEKEALAITLAQGGEK